MKSTKETAFLAAKKILEEKPLSLNEYEALMAIKETEKDLNDEETMDKLAKLRCWARTKHPCREALKILAGISKKLKK